MTNDLQTALAEEVMGLAVSLATLASEPIDNHPVELMEDLLVGAGPEDAAQAVLFLGRLLTHYMAPADIRGEADAVIEIVVSNGF
jgi:hypothetical protein